ncbi:MAG: RagB/SusD family nutrient uptake outer membrane protein, partial [Bacteroidales bacterium]|nr:RagB/SusD family nutrient uptake outer membrane protein [Bacteroidales bacterium]
SVNILRKNHGKIPALTVSGTSVSVNGTAITKAPGDPAENVLIQEIRRERRSELMADGFRHDDLYRWALGKNLDLAQNPDGYLGASRDIIIESAEADGIDAGTIDEKNYFVTIGGVQYKSPYEPGKNSRTWNDKYYLEPIPSNQLMLDPNIQQNPGW